MLLPFLKVVKITEVMSKPNDFTKQRQRIPEQGNTI